MISGILRNMAIKLCFLAQINKAFLNVRKIGVKGLY